MVCNISYQLLIHVIKLIKKIDFYIIKFQSDKVPLSDVVKCWDELSHLNEIALTQDEHEYLQLKVRARKEFILSDAHKIAYLLDPRYYPHSN